MYDYWLLLRNFAPVLVWLLLRNFSTVLVSGNFYVDCLTDYVRLLAFAAKLYTSSGVAFAATLSNSSGVKLLR